MNIATALFIADWLCRAILAVRVVMSRKPVPTSLAWLMVLLVPVPWVGVLTYAIVGEIRPGRRRVARQEAATRELLGEATVLWKARGQDWGPECEPYRAIAHLATLVGDLPPLRGNHVSLFAGSMGMIDSLVRDIDAARSHCHLLYYIWMDHSAGARVVEALERARGRGVACRVLVDGVGSKKFLRSDLRRRLERAGVEVVAALPVSAPRALVARLDVRNHRKIAVIDGWIAYSGSQNITDERFGYRPIDRAGPWIDASARIEGPAAQALALVFLRDWSMETESPVADHLETFLPERPVPKTGSIVQVVPSGPGQESAAIRDIVVSAIFAAKEEVLLTTPYFIPDEATKEALIAAALRGVRVSLVVPQKSDGMVVGAAGRAHLLELLAAGVRVYRHRPGLLHAKTLTVDSDVAMIGSANIDMRSFYINYEVTLFVYDTDVASQVRMLQTGYVGESEELEEERWRSRPAWRRALENTARLLTPVL
ncbi:MAG: cardiolipin synthase [Phycisphaerales bacterium]